MCFLHGQGQKREQKHTTKNFDEFHNHSPLLTMVHLGGEKHCESNMSCARTQRNESHQGLNLEHSIKSPAH